MDPVAPSVSIDAHSPGSAIISQRFVDVTRGWTELSGDWHDSEAPWSDVMSDATSVGFEVVLHEAGRCAIMRRDTNDGPVALMVHRYGSTGYDVSVVGATRAGVDAVAAAFAAFLPPIAYNNDATVPMTFWSFHPMMGGTSTTRRLPRLTWDAVQRNYPSVIRGELADLTAASTAPNGGKLMTFHGPPGNGKSRFIQTLAGEWSDWCSVHYVVDPDLMFADANYMNTVTLAEDMDDRWRLLVIEDGDEFLDNGAKSRVGYGVSRLLNLADGLVGQGLKLMVLITTNVSRVKFSKAMLRPGRCGAQIEFPSFSLDEAAEWCVANGVAAPSFGASKTVTLADLYAMLDH